MNRYFSILIAALFSLLGTIDARAQTFAPGQVWENQRGSQLSISSVTANGELKGTYTNQAAGFDCKGIPFDATGWALSDFITFQVLWKNSTKDCNSITAWTGFFASGKLDTKWDLVYIDATTKKPTLLQGADTFTKK